MPFVVTIPDDAETLIVELEQKYARAAAGIRMLWGTPEAEEFFAELATYPGGTDKAGFELSYLKLIQSIREIHIKDYIQRMTAKERAAWDAKHDAWSRAVALK